MQPQKRRFENKHVNLAVFRSFISVPRYHESFVKLFLNFTRDTIITHQFLLLPAAGGCLSRKHLFQLIGRSGQLLWLMFSQTKRTY